MLVPIITVPYVSRVLGPYGSGVSSYTNSCVTFFIYWGKWVLLYMEIERLHIIEIIDIKDR